MNAALAATLQSVADLLRRASEPWWVIGSAAVVLHGGATDVADVDVLMGRSDLDRLARTIGKAVAPGSPDARFRSDAFVTWATPDLPIELMAGLAVADAGRWHPVVPVTRDAIMLDDRRLHVPGRADLVAILHRFGRPKDLARAALLRPLA